MMICNWWEVFVLSKNQAVRFSDKPKLSYRAIFHWIVTSTTELVSTLTAPEVHTASSRQIITEFTFGTI
jgi:serine protease inhibitor